MFDPEMHDTDEVLIVSTSFWLRLASIPAFLFFLCWTTATLVAPICFIAGGNTPETWIMCIVLAALTSLPTRLFWHGSQPLELRIYFKEGYYEMRQGFRRFTHVTRGKFAAVDHLTIWNKYENGFDVSYTTSLTWKNKRMPFTLSVTYNNCQKAVDWAASVAHRLNVPLYDRIRM